jgi:hypothetical protein
MTAYQQPYFPRAPMSPTGPIFSSPDMAAGIVAALMILGPLAMAGFCRWASLRENTYAQSR